MTLTDRASGGSPAGRPRGVPFDDLAERYARFNELRDRLLPTGEWLLANLPGGATAVDLGCGDGLHTARLAQRYQRVLAVDSSPGMLAVARQRHHHPRIRYEQRGVLDLTPERDGRFDAVVSINTLHHVGPLEVVFPRVRRLAGPGARVVLADIVDPGGWRERDWHIQNAFAGARSFYEMSGGDPDAAADTLRLLLHPRWLELSLADIPPTRQEFTRLAAEAFPGAVFHHDLHPVMCGLVWQAP